MTCRSKEWHTILSEDMGGDVSCLPLFLGSRKAAALFEQFRAELAFGPEHIVLYGKAMLAPRETVAMGDPGLTYRFAGQTKSVVPWSPAALDLKHLVEAELGIAFNFVLWNKYADGSKYIGYHSDDTRDLVAGSTIASVSLGAERDMVFKDKRTVKARSRKLTLAHGSLLTMPGQTQVNYKHAIPATKRVSSVRINATFRQIKV